MLLSRFPRLHVAHLPTPLEPMDNLSRLRGGPRLWIKRDDCTGLAGGGYKTRRLKSLMADATGSAGTQAGLVAGLIGLLRRSEPGQMKNAVFLPTGGAQALFGYRGAFHYPDYRRGS